MSFLSLNLNFSTSTINYLKHFNHIERNFLVAYIKYGSRNDFRNNVVQPIIVMFVEKIVIYGFAFSNYLGKGYCLTDK